MSRSEQEAGDAGDAGPSEQEAGDALFSSCLALEQHSDKNISTSTTERKEASKVSLVDSVPFVMTRDSPDVPLHA